MFTQAVFACLLMNCSLQIESGHFSCGGGAPVCDRRASALFVWGCGAKPPHTPTDYGHSPINSPGDLQIPRSCTEKSPSSSAAWTRCIDPTRPRRSGEDEGLALENRSAQSTPANGT